MAKPKPNPDSAYYRIELMCRPKDPRPFGVKLIDKVKNKVVCRKPISLIGTLRLYKLTQSQMAYIDKVEKDHEPKKK